MKYLGLPQFDDFTIIRKLAQKNNLSSYPLLEQNLTLIEAEYAHYNLVQGNAGMLNLPLTLAQILKDGLQADYGRNLKDLNYIDDIRNKASKDVCPMCGSFSTSQVDHIIPKGIYPEFSLFARNLVPICNCNQKKSKIYKDGSGGRILHPYYDKELGERIAYIAFSGDTNSPDLGVEIVLKFKTQVHIKFHVDSVLRKTNVLNWASVEWAKIQNRPRAIFGASDGPIRKSDVKKILEERFIEADEYYGTPNNWKSMFYYGLALKNDFYEYIRDCANNR